MNRAIVSLAKDRRLPRSVGVGVFQGLAPMGSKGEEPRGRKPEDGVWRLDAVRWGRERRCKYEYSVNSNLLSCKIEGCPTVRSDKTLPRTVHAPRVWNSSPHLCRREKRS